MKKVVFCFFDRILKPIFKSAVAMVLLLAILLCHSNFMACQSEVVVEASTRGAVAEAALPSLRDIIKDIFSKNDKEEVDDRKIMVYPGGLPLGFTLECDGVMVVAIGSVQTLTGVVKPLENKNVKVGDVVKSVDGVDITSAAGLQETINKNNGNPVALEIVRDGKTFMESAIPVLEASTQTYRLGLWIRDNAAGVGTLTYVRCDNNRFGALGHPISDIDTGKTLPISGGYIYKCNIVGVNKGTRGNPGELRGLFLKNGSQAGELDNNNDYGVYGNVGEEYLKNISSSPIEVGFRNTVKTGKAKILTTIDGDQPNEYDIEIIKLNHQSKSDTKSMVIKVIDPRLIEATGGIVQGMSGSPIIQGGKLVGAVTHVFVSDPTKGFGVYIDWMIDN